LILCNLQANFDGKKNEDLQVTNTAALVTYWKFRLWRLALEPFYVEFNLYWSIYFARKKEKGNFCFYFIFSAETTWIRCADHAPLYIRKSWH
jgi:hypothetical protein